MFFFFFFKSKSYLEGRHRERKIFHLIFQSSDGYNGGAKPWWIQYAGIPFKFLIWVAGYQPLGPSIIAFPFALIANWIESGEDTADTSLMDSGWTRYTPNARLCWVLIMSLRRQIIRSVSKKSQVFLFSSQGWLQSKKE